MRKQWLQRAETIVQGQQRAVAERPNHRLFLSCEDGEMSGPAPIGASLTWVRLRHFRTVVGLIP